jgi:hypothetical protein
MIGAVLMAASALTATSQSARLADAAQAPGKPKSQPTRKAPSRAANPAPTAAPLPSAAAPRAPEPPPQQVPGRSPTEGAPLDQDLITRYRFSERYGTNVEVTDDGRIGQYRVAIKETVKEVVVKPNDGDVHKTGASGKAALGNASAIGKAATEPATPSKEAATPSKESFQDKHIIYTDRAADVSGLGQVKSLIRHYERARLTSDPDPSHVPDAHSVEGLTIWYRPQIDPLPVVLSLSSDRPLTESDYKFTALQLFVPNLANLLPPTTVRIGDNWPISKMAVKTLVGADRVAEGGLIGRLSEIRKDSRGGERDRVAVIDVSGQMLAQVGYGAMKMQVHAQLEFAFTPPRITDAGTGKSSDLATVDARGAIVWLSLVQEGLTAAVSKLDPRPRKVKRELVLERQLTNTGTPLEIPRDPPKPNPENSWLAFADPQRRFQFRHPQDLHHPQEYGYVPHEGPDQIELIHFQLGGTSPDRVMIEISPTTRRDPEEVRNKVAALGKEGKLEVLQGTTGWLPDVDWPGMRVYRFENAYKGATARGVQRIHSDSYVIYFTGREASVVVTATTAQDPPLQFRKDIEEMLKTFEWNGPETPQPRVSSPPPSPGSSP